MKTYQDCTYYQVRANNLKEGSCCVNPPMGFVLQSPRGAVFQCFDVGVTTERFACKLFEVKIELRTEQ